MRTLLSFVFKALYLLVAGILALAVIVPSFLDRLYYQGPPSSHFDGAHFFNPDEDMPLTGSAGPRFLPSRMFHFFFSNERPAWPDTVPVTPTRPPARVEGQAMRVTWIGHSTVLVQTQGLNILTDPIWSTYASPIPGLGPKRHRAPGVRFEDLPKIDLVLISHSHYDHLDIPTVRRLWARDHPLIVTALGNDAILRAKGVQAVARDWGGKVAIRPGISVFIDRVHHWGTRFARDRNRMLWSGFTVALPGGNLFFAGDTGLGDGRWPGEAARHGPVRMALIPIGAYLPRAMMAESHIGPAEAVIVFERLGAAYALGVHWGTFQLSFERIGDPPRELSKALAQQEIDRGRFRTTEVGAAWTIPLIRQTGPAPSPPQR